MAPLFYKLDSKEESLVHRQRHLIFIPSDMKFEKGKYYLLTLLDGTHHRVKFKGEDPANLLKFINKDGSPFTVPTGGFTEAKEVD